MRRKWLETGETGDCLPANKGLPATLSRFNRNAIKQVYRRHVVSLADCGAVYGDGAFCSHKTGPEKRVGSRFASCAKRCPPLFSTVHLVMRLSSFSGLFSFAA